MKNYSDTICSKKNRTLTAKANKFKERVICLVAEKNNFNKYQSEFKPLKDKLRIILDDLFIDKGLSISEVKELIKQSICPEIEKLN